MAALLMSDVRRDNAGFIMRPIDVPRGCKGPACPAFAFCQGRCAVRRADKGAVPSGIVETFRP
jgi:hypothetical protein